MVVFKKKFICGLGTVLIHYCRVCGAPYLSQEEAEECEEKHSPNTDEGGDNSYTR